MKRRGFSLIELSSAMVSVSLLTTMLFWTLAAGRTLWTQSDTAIRIQQDLHRDAGPQLERELRRSLYASLVNLTGDDSPALSFASAADCTGFCTNVTTGDPVWKTQIVYYVPVGTTRLMRAEVPFSGVALTPAQVRSTVAAGSGLLVADTIASLLLTGRTLTLTASVPGFRQTLTMEVSPCN